MLAVVSEVEEIKQAWTQAVQTYAMRKANNLPADGTADYIDQLLDEYLRVSRNG